MILINFFQLHFPGRYVLIFAVRDGALRDVWERAWALHSESWCSVIRAYQTAVRVDTETFSPINGEFLPNFISWEALTVEGWSEGTSRNERNISVMTLFAKQSHMAEIFGTRDAAVLFFSLSKSGMILDLRKQNSIKPFNCFLNF